MIQFRLQVHDDVRKAQCQRDAQHMHLWHSAVLGRAQIYRITASRVTAKMNARAAATCPRILWLNWFQGEQDMRRTYRKSTVHGAAVQQWRSMQRRAEAHWERC